MNTQPASKPDAGSAVNRPRHEERLNALTHAAGVSFSVAGLAVLVVLAVRHGTVWHVVSFSVYGSTLLVLFNASMLYHFVESGDAKRILRKLDHSSIFLLIAGTYTPFALTSLRGGWGWSLLGVVWGLCLGGIVGECLWTRRFRRLSLPLYLAMGWLIVIAIRPAVARVPHTALLWLAGGGLLYSAGAVFYAMKRLPYGHTIWHVFVLAASVCHYLGVIHLVAPLHLS